MPCFIKLEQQIPLLVSDYQIWNKAPRCYAVLPRQRFFHLSTAYSFDLACTHCTGLLLPYLNFAPRLSTMSSTSSKSSSLDLAQIDSVDIVNPDDAYILSILNDPSLSLLERNTQINRLIGITRQRSLLHQEVIGLGSLPSSDNLLSLFIEMDYNAPALGTSLQFPRSL